MASLTKKTQARRKIRDDKKLKNRQKRLRLTLKKKAAAKKSAK